jgi:hypothetical protein
MATNSTRKMLTVRNALARTRSWDKFARRGQRENAMRSLVVRMARVVGFTLVSLGAMSVGSACTIFPQNMRELDRDSDVIAIGVIDILREQVEHDGELHESATGVARIDVRDYERNREQRGRWIEFRYQYGWEDLCGFYFGFRPEQGQTVKIWFGRRGNGFEVLRFEPVDQSGPEEPAEDDS